MEPQRKEGGRLYVPEQLSEIQDFLICTMAAAPHFNEVTFYGYHRSIDNQFASIRLGLAAVADKVDEERYRTVLAYADEAKSLFLADPDDTNGKTTEGCDKLMAIYDILEEVRGERYHAGILDFEGLLTGD
jgi:hypothetical protein